MDKNKIPDEILILPLDGQVAYPTLNMALAVPEQASSLIETAMKGNHFIGIVGTKSLTNEVPLPGQLFETGTVVRVLYVTRAPNNTVLLVFHGMRRFRITKWVAGQDFLRAKIELTPETIESDVETEALHRSLRDLTQEIFSLYDNVPNEAIEGLTRIKGPLHLAYIAAAHSEIDYEKRQALLEEDSLKAKLRELVKLLSREKEILSLGKKIRSDVHDEMNKSQRNFYLRQQLKAIKKELGEPDEDQTESDDYQQRIAESDMTDEARKEAMRELSRLEEMSPQSAEYSMVKTYIEWLLELPWNRSSEDQTDIGKARGILDKDHYGLQGVKDRIIEYLAVRNLLAIREVNKTNDLQPITSAAGVILCFAGPPGVGKTSLGQSIARAMGREFTRMSLGGVRDEAEIRGHRRTYIGAMPGRIIQAIKRAGTRNPVFMLDEVDKIGMDWRGDPSSALLEVLDPAQNAAFRDHYLDVDFDLSDVVFITTANQLDTIPAPLRDRMEIIQLDGYTELEKIQIAKRHLIPRQLASHALQDSDVTFMDEAVRKIIADYTREAGVRQLERLIGAICRKSIVKLTSGTWQHVMMTPELVADNLKKEKFERENSETIDVPGISTGLAVTSVGGDILFVEATRMNGNGKLTVTGQLGDVMKESASIAHSYVRSKTKHLEIRSESFKKTDVHLHVPAGAVPKDGPSAGVAMVMALASLYSNRLVRSKVGMTGEVTLRGRVLPVGGIKMKVLAAHRAGLNTVILPKRNEKDLEDVPSEVRNSMDFILVDRIDEAFEAALIPAQFGNGAADSELDQIYRPQIEFAPITA
ncbi:MAG: endopeptidase La [Deltaproteobacteria bacterium]|nr:endopeptidase La [Deltaproteobacteria bacterium]